MNTKDDNKSGSDAAQKENEVIVWDDQIDSLVAINGFGFPWTATVKGILQTLSLIRERFLPEGEVRRDEPQDDEDDSDRKRNPIYHEVCEKFYSVNPDDPFSKIKSLTMDYRIFNRNTKTVLSICMDSKKKSLLHCEMYRVMAAGDSADGNNRVPLFSKDIRFTQKTIGKALDDLVSTWKEKDAESDVEENAVDSLIGEI